jgi:hypothetical protein
VYDGAFAEGRAVGGALHVRRAGGGRARVVGRQAADGAAPEEEGEEDLVEAAEQRALLRRLREDTTGFVRAAARGDRARVVAAAHAGVPLEARVRLLRLREEPWVPQQVLGEDSERRPPARAPACTASVTPASSQRVESALSLPPLSRGGLASSHHGAAPRGGGLRRG